MPTDYIPAQDAELIVWMTNFMTYATANTAALGLTAADLTPLNGYQTSFSVTFNANVAAQDAAQAARQAKTESRTSLENAVRAVVRRVQASATVTNAQRQALGVTVKDKKPTPVGVPTTRPVGQVDTAQRLQHTIDFADEMTATSKAKPAGVMGCEIWHLVGGATPPVDNSTMSFLATDTKTPYVAHYAGADANKTAYYMLRWVNAKGEPGPWSAVVSATIGG